MSSIVRQPVLYPVSVVFVDDSADFLHALRGFFPDAPLHRFYTDPHEALAFVSSHAGRHAAKSPVSGHAWSEFEKKGGNALGDDVMADPARFTDIAALVVDCEMPGMDGIQFLASVSELGCSKILLTGTADESHAVEAFNAGLIDYYLKKTDPAMARKLARVLAEAKQKYCAGHGHIGVHGVGSIYANQHARDVLEEVAARERIVEYYWRPEQNAVLTFDAHGRRGVFIAWDSHDWDAQCDVLDDEGGPAELLDAMRARSVMPVFWPYEAYRPDLAEVRMATPAPVPGLEDTHWSWTRLDGGEPEPGVLTFAAWRGRH
ncbi:response regulator [Paraburkholderia sp. J12]|uniref:response regulator n=1 Tax=Paraburkholderia sp. J12 TaxID=2805432 RepID=UPI002ABE6B50|nr:response regulator [Paraburkholderia sp. J12]